MYNYEIKTNPAILNDLAGNLNEIMSEPSPPITRREVENAVGSLRDGKPAGIDNIPAELLRTEDVLYSYFIRSVVRHGKLALAKSMDQIHHCSITKEMRFTEL